MVNIINFFIDLYWLIPLVKIKNTIFTKVFSFNTETLLLKIIIFRPYANGISLETTFLCSYCCLYSLSEKIIFNVDIFFNPNGSRNIAVNFSWWSVLCWVARSKTKKIDQIRQEITRLWSNHDKLGWVPILMLKSSKLLFLLRKAAQNILSPVSHGKRKKKIY